MSPERRNYQSKLMSTYNKARKAARQGKLDEKRVNRALGLLLSGETRPYNTTVKTCDCPDSRKGNICKHRIKLMIQVRMG